MTWIYCVMEVAVNREAGTQVMILLADLAEQTRIELLHMLFVNYFHRLMKIVYISFNLQYFDVLDPHFIYVTCKVGSGRRFTWRF